MSTEVPNARLAGHDQNSGPGCEFGEVALSTIHAIVISLWGVS